MFIAANQVAEVLGGKRVLGEDIQTNGDLEQAVVRGLPSEALKVVIEQLYPDQPEKLYQLIPRSTLVRKLKEDKPLPLEYSQKLERLARIYAFALEVWQNEDDAREFLTKPHPMLEDRTPTQAAQTELGARQVEEILGRALFGSAA